MGTQDYAGQTRQLLEHLRLEEEPFGIVYSDEKPEDGFAPKAGMPISRELEEQGKFDMRAALANFSCLLGNIRLARKKKRPAYISAEQYGCPGGGFYTGMYFPHLRTIEHFVSTGIPGTPMHGERYMPSPEAMRAFMERMPGKAEKKYCIFKPLSLFTANEEPEFVVLFLRPEAMSGLFAHTGFVTGEVDGVVSPFGAGCTSLVGWPRYYRERGEERAVLGGFDPSQRKFMDMDELTFTVPLGLYQKLLAALPESLFCVGDTWKDVRKKAVRGNAAWNAKRGE